MPPQTDQFGVPNFHPSHLVGGGAEVEGNGGADCKIRPGCQLLAVSLGLNLLPISYDLPLNPLEYGLALKGNSVNDIVQPLGL